MIAISNDSPDIPDEQIDRICDGLKQSAAKIRFLQRMGLNVSRRPNGKPLVTWLEWERLHAKRAEDKKPLETPLTANGPRWKKTAKG